MQGKSALGIVQKYHPAVMRVVDAKRPTVIEVTKANCKSAKTKAPNACAMARAFEQEHDGAIISMSVAYIVDGNKATRYTVPAAVSREIVSFDRKAGFAPGIYKLNPPDAHNRLGVKAHPQKIKNRNTDAKHKRRLHRTAGIRSL